MPTLDSVVITLVVITLIGENLFPMADRRKQGDELSELAFIQMTQLFPMTLVNPVLHLMQQVQSAARNSGHHVAPVLAAPLANDQLRVFKAIEKPCDVRYLPHQPLRDFTAAEARGLRPTQNSQNVVLRGGNPVRFQSGLKGVFEQCRCPLDAEVCFLFEALERPCLFQFCL